MQNPEDLNGLKLCDFLEKFGVLEKLNDEEKIILKEIEEKEDFLNRLLHQPTIDSVFTVFEFLHNQDSLSKYAQDVFFEEKMHLVGRG